MLSLVFGGGLKQLKMEIFKNTEYPKKSKDLKGNEEEFSVDVISCDVSGMLNLCYWNYDTNIWMFHTDTLCDPYEGGKLIDFVWMYRPDELSVGSKSKTFDIHNCINDVCDSVHARFHLYGQTAKSDGSFRWLVKQAIDKMLYSR